MKIKYFLVLIGYYLMVVLPHQQIGGFLGSFFLPHSRVRYNGIMLGIFCFILIIVGIWIWRKVARHDRFLIGTYTVLTSIFIAICINVLFVLNVEAIHFVQYAIFAIICFQINKSYWKTMFWSIIAGAGDELYQYVYLAPKRSEYYDFNDVVIDAVGAGIGLIIIRVLNPQTNKFNLKSFFRSNELRTALLLMTFIGIGMMAGYISYGPDPTAVFCFLKIDYIEFWHCVAPVIYFHVVKPIEGIIALIFLAICYSYLETGSNEYVASTKD